ncbi:hypothetical protein DFJ77DRAFT_314609 [Powellomyces hirtus]|nr:hypothetical protein DFJ77DRAFT_314609 [Powellomyces hirtus]
MDELDELLADLQDGVSTFRSSPSKPVGADSQKLISPRVSDGREEDNGQHDMAEFVEGGVDHDTNGNLVPNSTPCFSCSRPIIGACVMALGDRSFHQDCFRCCIETCRRRLVGLPYFEMFPDVYCEGCYHDKFSKRCAYCEEPIRERLISALGKSFHPEHFFCCQCGKNFGVDESFMESDGMAYCPEDFMALFAFGCTKCKKALVGDYITAAGKKFHRECFGCTACKRPLATDGYFEHDGNAYCERDYHVLTAPQCATCEGPLIGRVVRVCDKRYHPDCFQCCFCKTQLDVPSAEPGWGGQSRGAKVGFKTFDQSPYCHNCFLKLYA